jgi:hypothetical protein
MQILEDVNLLLTKYTHYDGPAKFRPSIQDYITYYTLISMYESDYNDTEPYYIWRKKPDEIMQLIIDSERLFTIDFGWEDLDESLREWLANEEHIISADDVDEDEYQTNLKGA